MLNSSLDSVSNIHRRWSFTRLNPSSYKVSYIISILSAIIIIFISQGYHTKIDQINLLSLTLLGLTALTVAHFLDFFALKRTPINKISKVFHVSAFANLLWFFTLLFGLISNLIFSKSENSISYYIIEGLLLAVGLRISIFTSVFGAGLGRAVLASFIQPLIFLFAFEHSSSFYYQFLTYPIGLGFGFALVVIGILWTIIADRAGRPRIKSTFGVLQAFLAAWTENKADKMEKIAESKAHNEVVSTYIIKFKRANSKGISIILPQLHPGPFNPIGGSNLPYMLYTLFSKNALIMHSVSDHSLNIPSKIEMKRYIDTLSSPAILENGNTCTLPAHIKIEKSSVTGIAFGNTAMLFLSMAPTGMEDVPDDIRIDIEQYSSQLGFNHVITVDSHNAMGPHLRKPDSDNLLLAAKQCLGRLKDAQHYEFKIGFANSEDIFFNTSLGEDLGQSGLAVVVIEVAGSRYAIGWADANNMENGIRDHIISTLNDNGIKMVEVCTSDTHSTSGKRTRQGYFTLGNVSNPDEIAKMYLQISKKSIEKADISTFDLLLIESNVKVMGKKQFEDYSSALDKSMNITKIFLGVTFMVFLTMLIIT
jgi:putative membrane protein